MSALDPTASGAALAGDGLVHASVDELLALRFQVPRVRAGRRARAATSGQHRSQVHARGVDYAESRIYQPGDDIRVMDWRVTARTGKPHTKLFLEERERALVLLLDLNPGMRFGTRVRFKSVQALRIAALAAWMTVASGDRVGAQVFGRQNAWIRPRGGSRGVLAMIRELLRLDRDLGAGEQSLSAAITQLQRRLHGGGRVLLVSDGFSCDPRAATAMRRLRRQADVAIVGVADRLEMAPPAVSQLAVASGKQRLRLQLAHRAEREAFMAAVGQGRQRLDALAQRSRVPLRWLDTTAQPQAALLELLDQTLAGRRR